MDSKHDEGGNLSGEGSQKGKNIKEEDGYHNGHSFYDHSHTLMYKFTKVDLNKFDESNPISWVNQME